MDLREKKTKRNIKNAFIELRAHKALERITIKELAEKAEISKATFYLHYHDIYDLSDQLQKEVIQDILNSLDHPELLMTDSTAFTAALFHAFYAQQTLIDILFSGSQSAVLPLNIEKELKKYIFERTPSSRQNPQLNILLTYQILGGYHVYQQYHKQYDLDFILNVISEGTKVPFQKFFQEEDPAGV